MGGTCFKLGIQAAGVPPATSSEGVCRTLGGTLGNSAEIEAS